MKTPCQITAADIRAGDTIQWEEKSFGIENKRKMIVNEVEAEVNHYVCVTTSEGGNKGFQPDADLTLLDRPAPQLPTKPGSVIIAYEVSGVRNDDGWAMIIGPDGALCAGIRIASTYWHGPEHITDWVPATVIKVEP